MTVQLYLGDCLDVMAEMDADSVDSIVTDPPYGLSFMGKEWDHGVPGIPFWTEALRVAKPGAHLLAFGGTRTHHRLACAIEDAGWEIRDTVMWVYGSGFPKSMDVSKAIDKAAGAKREVVGPNRYAANHPNPRGKAVGQNYGTDMNPTRPITAPATPDAAKWQGWGTALKPAWEPVIVARKPLIGTVAANVLEYGTGAMNIDGCRVGTESVLVNRYKDRNYQWGVGTRGDGAPYEGQTHVGRWPANLIHDGSDEVTELFPQAGGGKFVAAGAVPRTASKFPTEKGWNGNSLDPSATQSPNNYGDSGSAARFFYCAKASKSDRDEGLEEMEERGTAFNDIGFDETKRNRQPRNNTARNFHPTVKPTALMRYLVRLVTPPGGIVLDPFMGSGSTGKAAALEGFSFVGIELDAEYLEIARRRIEHAQMQPTLDGLG